ncbi:glycoside hydrolase family 97 C-terminal domain-containing protein [Paenibacillus sp. FSL H8-0548]
MTNEQVRESRNKLGFLEEHTVYNAYIYSDSLDKQVTPTQVAITIKEVN